MKRILTFMILWITYCNVYSQESPFHKPNYDLIRRETQDSTSGFFYPKLLSRLVAFDTTLTNEDYRHLYYGYIYQEDYKPYWSSPYEKKLLKYYQSERVKDKDHDEIIELATLSISEFPFDLRQMNYLGYIYHLKGDEDMAKKLSYRFHATIGAIMSSGDGETCRTGFHVISTSHEYVILNLFRFQFERQSYSDGCDYLSLIKDERDIEGIYFDVKKLFEKNSENSNKK
ncbi:MAG: DUF4919 domain-containing protein [Cyclobacteriaceae bacterium]